MIQQHFLFLFIDTDHQVQLIYPVSVVVVGTEERNYQSLSKHTIYITEIRIQKIVLKIFVRYSEILKLSEAYRQRFPNLNLEPFQNNQWLSNHKTKVIEYRKMAIEKFLQTILSSEEARGSEKVLVELSLPNDFYSLPDLLVGIQEQQNKIRISQAPYRNQLSMEFRETLSAFGIDPNLIKVSAAEILRGYTLAEKQIYLSKIKFTLSRYKVHISQIVKTKMGVIQGSNQHDFKVDIFILDGTKIPVGISHDTRAAEIVETVAQQINLKQFDDFKLYIVDRLNNLRVIDDDEVLIKVIFDEAQTSQTIVKKAIHKIEGIFSKSSSGPNFRIELRKYFFLPLDKEEYDIKRDPVRLRIMAYQIMKDIFNQKYHLSFKEYCLFAALYIHTKFFLLVSLKSRIKQYSMGMHQGDCSISNLQECESKAMASQRFRPHQDNYQSTFRYICICFQSLCIPQQQNTLSESTSLEQSRRMLPILKKFDQLSQMVIFNSIKGNILFSMGVYYVETYHKTISQLKLIKKDIYPNIYLGIYFSKLYFLTPSRKEVFNSFEYQSIDSIKSFPMQIIFTIKNCPVIYRFDTHQSYEIKMLIEDYQSLQSFSSDFNLNLITQ